MTDLVASPLTCVLEHALQGQQVERALFCTYTFDAGYFERIALSPLDAIGAQITVIADARMAHIDPYAARRAGTRYGLGLVHHRAAFHPKLFVLLGDDHCTLGIGSANVTAAGWHQSEELWTVISTTTAESSESAVSETGRWLTSLAATATLGPRAAQTVASIGRRLTEMDATGGSAQVIGNVERPILEQLPSGPVDELNLYAPFHGNNASAVAALCDRFTPSLLRIGYQPELTSLNPDELLAVTNTFAGDVEYRALTSDRYRHGKLIEWRTSDGWQSLTGSPNLSHAALQSTPARGGNYELAALTANDVSLFPAPDPEAPSEALHRLHGAEPQATPADTGPRILEAVLDGDIVELTLVQPAAHKLTVDAAPAGRPPEQWLPWGEVTDGATRSELDPLAGGSWVRVVDAAGEPSPAVVVLGPAAFRLRHGSGAATSAPLPSVDDLFDDTNAASRFLHHFGALSEQLTADRPLPSSTSGASGGGSGARRHESWDEYLDRVTGHLGENLLRFSLGLSLHSPQAGGGANWDDEDIDDSEAGLDDDTAEDLADIAQRLSVGPDPTGLTEAMRQRLVRQLTDLSFASRLNDPILQLLALRLTLAFLAGGAWPPGDDSWVSVLLAHVDRLASQPSNEPEIRRRQGALAALSLSVCRAEVPRLPETVLSSQISRSTARAASLIDDLHPVDLDAYCSDLGERLGFRAQPDGVIDFALTAVTSTPFSTAVQTLAELDDPIEAIDQAPVLALPEPFTGNHLQRAHLPLKLLQGAGDVAVQVGAGDAAHVVVWAAPIMVHLRHNPRGPVADVYRFHSGSEPADRQGTADFPRPTVLMGPTADWSEVDHALSRVGLSR